MALRGVGGGEEVVEEPEGLLVDALDAQETVEDSGKLRFQLHSQNYNYIMTYNRNRRVKRHNREK